MTPARDYDGLAASFRWTIPARYNIGHDVCDRWALTQPDRPAVHEIGADGARATLTFGALRDRACRLAGALARRGIGRGDRVAILLPQSAAVLVSHVAVYRLGAIAVPLAVLFGADALAYRLKDAGVRAVVTNAAGLAKLGVLRAELPDLALLISVDGAEGDAEGFERLIATTPPAQDGADTGPNDPALMIYTSGTTGPPKGALHGHRVLLGHLPGFAMMHDLPPRPDDLHWTPADWAWAGGLLNVLLPALHHGSAVIARKFEKFEPEAALDLIAREGVRNLFMPPTALRMLRGVEAPRRRFDLSRLATLASAGEALGAETAAFAAEALGVPVNEAYGQTECNLVIASSRALGVARAGATGRPVPGHAVAVLRPDGSPCAVDEVGDIAVRRPDPVMFLRYWNQPEATADKFSGDWMTTGDQARVDGDGYVHFVGREDDLITSAGYRIGPGEVEECLMRHPAVAMAAVVGKRDALRTEIVKAFVVPSPGYMPSDALAADIRDFVRARLSGHEYPREIAFRAALPMTTTGKVIRRALREDAGSPA